MLSRYLLRRRTPMLEKYQAPMMKAVVRLECPPPPEEEEDEKGKKREMKEAADAEGLLPGRASPGGVGGMSMTGSDSRRGLLPRRVVQVFPWAASTIAAAAAAVTRVSVTRVPIFLTMIHMVSCSLYSAAAVRWLRLVPLQPVSSRRQLLKIAALSAIFCFSVVCGNTSLRYLPVSFNQAIGATTPFFTAIFALLITCHRESATVYLALLPVVLGIVVASNSEPLFHLFGFLVCVGSTAGRALKSVVQGILLTSEAEKLNSMNLLMYMSPMAAAMLLPLSLWIEGNIAATTVVKAAQDPRLILFLFANATVAYLVNLTNFLVTKHTSALTLQVLGNAKAAVAAIVSVLIFQNPVTVMGMAGFGITILGVVLYSEAKKRSKSSSPPASPSPNSSSSH